MKIWTVIYQWEGQDVPHVASFRSKDEAVKGVRRYWDQYARQADLPIAEEMPEILFRGMTLCCDFDSQEWCWIVESELAESEVAHV